MLARLLARHLREDVTIQKPVFEVTDAGGYDNRWQTVAVVKGHIIPISGREYNIAGKPELHATHRLYTTQVDTEIKHGYKVIFRGSEYDVVNPADVNNMGKLLQVDLRQVERDTDEEK